MTFLKHASTALAALAKSAVTDVPKQTITRILKSGSFFARAREAALLASRRRPEDVKRFLLAA